MIQISIKPLYHTPPSVNLAVEFWFSAYVENLESEYMLSDVLRSNAKPLVKTIQRVLASFVLNTQVSALCIVCCYVQDILYDSVYMPLLRFLFYFFEFWSIQEVKI